MQFVTKNLLTLMVGALLLIVILQQCKSTPEIEAPTVVRDTVLVVKESFTTTKPQVVETILAHDSIITKEYVPDTNYAKLVLQYQEVVNQLLAKIPTLGVRSFQAGCRGKCPVAPCSLGTAPTLLTTCTP